MENTQDATKDKVKNPNRVAAGKRLAERNKIALAQIKAEKEQQSKNNNKQTTSSTITSSSFDFNKDYIYVLVVVAGLGYLAYNHKKDNNVGATNAVSKIDNNAVVNEVKNNQNSPSVSNNKKLIKDF